MTVAQLKAALDDLGVTYPKKARKAELEALHASVTQEVSADVMEVVERIVAGTPLSEKAARAIGVLDLDEPWFWPDWAERVDRLPPGLQKRHVLKRGVNGGKPSGKPPRGIRWVTGDMPGWLKEL